LQFKSARALGDTPGALLFLRGFSRVFASPCLPFSRSDNTFAAKLMPDFRAFCTPPGSDPLAITLAPDESHHLVAVNRVRAGGTVIAFDGQGTEWVCDLVHARKNAATLRVQSTRRVPRLPYAIALAQAIPKGPAMDAIVRKATEIGATRIVPLESERTQVHVESDRVGRKLDKWQTAAIEAAKQCGNPFLPAIEPVQNATRFMASASGYDLKLIASLHPGAQSLKRVLASYRATASGPPRTVLWLVGPEGDFSPAEIDVSRRNAFEPVTLGPLVLRSETAAVYALSILSYELQNA
jgi:16S rRNA (uracil1498-N3)-methyltransferase